VVDEGGGTSVHKKGTAGKTGQLREFANIE